MKLDDVLTKASKVSQAHDHTVVYLRGAVETDHDPAYFRLYRKPQNRRSYLLVKKEDLAGDLHQWSLEETIHAGFVGTTIYNVPVRIGSQVQGVSVTLHKIGELAAGKVATAKDQVCCCDNCVDTNTCGLTDSATCEKIGVVCPGAC